MNVENKRLKVTLLSTIFYGAALVLGVALLLWGPTPIAIETGQYLALSSVGATTVTGGVYKAVQTLTDIKGKAELTGLQIQPVRAPEL